MPEGMPHYYEPGADDLAVAVNMRRMYTAFLTVGFTDEQALRMVIAAIGTVRHQS